MQHQIRRPSGWPLPTRFARSHARAARLKLASSRFGPRLAIATVTSLGLAMSSCGGAAFHARESRMGEWYALATPHVRLQTDVGSRDARETAWALEDLHRALAQVFFDCRAGALEEPVDVTLFAQAEDYRAVSPPGSVGLFWPAESDLVAMEPRVVLPARVGHSRGAVLQTYAHELTHRFVEGCLPDAPTWLGEGLAKYFETLRVDDNDVLLGVPPFRFDDGGPMHAVRADGLRVQRVDPDGLPSLAALFGLSRQEFYAGDADPNVVNANHAAAWAFVHMMLAGPDPDLRARFGRYLSALSDGRADASSALETAFEGIDLDALFASYVRAEHARQRVAFTRGGVGEPLARRLEIGEVNLRWGELLARAGATDEARAHLHAAEQSPAFEARALLLLASLTYGIERRDLVARAEAIAPGTREVLGARAWIAFEEDGAADERLELLRDLAALESPTAVELARWADLLRLNGDAQPAVAISERAIELSPTSWEAHASLALSLASVHRFPESRAAFERALHLTSHHLPGTAAQLDRLMARVESFMPQPLGDTPPADDLRVVELDRESEPLARMTGTTEATLDARRFGGTCVGFVGTTPAAVVDVPADMPALAIYAQASGASPELRDTVLVVETSTGAMRCDDDSGGWPDPGIFAQLPAGRTRIWVGTYESERAGTPFTLTLASHRPLGNEPIPSACGLAQANGEAHGPVIVGARVVLGRHTPVSGGGDDALHAVTASTNWMPEMESFVGREATVTQLEGQDGAGCAIVRVDADAGSWLWRVRDMSRPPS